MHTVANLRSLFKVFGDLFLQQGAVDVEIQFAASCAVTGPWQI